MNPLDKLREEVHGWREAASAARAALRIAEGVLPGLEAQLREEERRTKEGEASEGKPGPGPKPRAGKPKPSALPKVAVMPARRPMFTGECTDQVWQALCWNPDQDQTSKDLVAKLRESGRAYGPGAVGYALRGLKTQGKIEISRKVGNLVFYKAKPDAQEEA